jgi:uncharacterized protein (TIGR00255 family)
MTGFARAQDQDDPYGWTWEIKSVNGRGLDLRCRMPPGFEHLEMLAREAVRKRFKRGSISLNLAVARSDGQSRLRLNRELLEDLLPALSELGQRIGADPPRLDGLLAIRGVLEPVEDDQTAEAQEAREAAMMATLADALDALATMRGDEGSRIESVLVGQLDEIADLCVAADGSAAAQPETIKARLRDQLAELLDAKPAVAEDRLAQELALLAIKADVREEIDRLKAHVTGARELLAAGGSVGRRLDFLCQEINREANTICSKSTALELTRIGLDLKTTVDQVREQVQNVE